MLPTNHVVSSQKISIKNTLYFGRREKDKFDKIFESLDWSRWMENVRRMRVQSRRDRPKTGWVHKLHCICTPKLHQENRLGSRCLHFIFQTGC
jgi:hypothetical protein